MYHQIYKEEGTRMAHKQFTMDDIILIEKYYLADVTTSRIIEIMGKKQPVYDVINFFKTGKNSKEFWEQRKTKQSRCGRKRLKLSVEEEGHVEHLLRQKWSLDRIANHHKADSTFLAFSMGATTLYRRVREGMFDKHLLPMKGKRKPNGHKEKRGKQAFTRNIAQRKIDHPNVEKEFGHLEGDTIVGLKHKSAVVTFAEPLSKMIFTFKPASRKAKDVGRVITDWLNHLPAHFFKSLTFDCGKEFSNWKDISNANDIDIYFCDPGTPSQRPLNENSNGILRRNGLPKEMDFNKVSETFIQSMSDERNRIPRRSLGFKTPMQVFVEEIHNNLGQAISLASLQKWAERTFCPSAV